MKSFKKLLVVLLAIVMVFAFAACGGSDNGGESEPAGDDQGSATIEGIPEEVFITVGDTVVQAGGDYGDYEGKLGDEIKPSERIEPCDPNTETADIEFYFDGLTLTTKEGGLVRMVDVAESEGNGPEILFSGKVGVGASVDEFKAIMGDRQPDTDDDDFVAYYFDMGNLLLYLEENDHTTVTSFIMGYNDL